MAIPAMGLVLPQKSPVAQRQATRSVELDHVLVVALLFHDDTTLVPFLRESPTLVLNHHSITDVKHRQNLCVFVQ